MTTPAIALPEPLPKRAAAVLLLLLGTVVVAIDRPTVPGFAPDRNSPAPSVSSGFDLPAHFVANAGEVVPGVAYYSRGAQVPVSFDSRGAKFAVENGDKRWGLRLAFREEARASEPVGQRAVPGVIDYLDDGPGTIRSVSRIVYADVWPGIDARFDARPNGGVEYSFALAPGADPERIQLAYRGSTSIAVDTRGRLHAATPIGDLVDTAPIAWQVIDGRRVGVDVDYRLLGGRAYTFRLGPHDPGRPLIIDPSVFAYVGYIGGDDDDAVNDIAVDGQGNAYVAGETRS